MKGEIAMPFSIRKQGKKFQVVNSDTGDVKGEHANEADAKKQLAALYANVPDARKDFTEVVVKSALAEMVPVEDDENASGPGTFHAIISSPKRDRDGDQLWADEWEQPLPDHIVINGDHDNKHIMSTVGSGPPTLESDNKIHVRGTYAETDFAQDTRKLVNGGHLRTLSCAYREKRGQKGVSRELVNASFVLVPSNTDCVVLDSKSYEIPEAAPTPNDMPGAAGKQAGKAFAALIKKGLSEMTPQDRAQAIHDMSFELGAECFTLAESGDQELQASGVKSVGTVLPEGFTATLLFNESDTGNDGIVKMLVVKDATGKEVVSHKFSQAPEAHGDDPSDSTADPAKEKALALAQYQLTTFTADEL